MSSINDPRVAQGLLALVETQVGLRPPESSPETVLDSRSTGFPEMASEPVTMTTNQPESVLAWFKRFLDKDRCTQCGDPQPVPYVRRSLVDDALNRSMILNNPVLQLPILTRPLDCIRFPGLPHCVR